MTSDKKKSIENEKDQEKRLVKPQNRNVLWLVAARSGSKGVPNKNVKHLGGVPLLAYRVRSALATGPSQSVWISTDSREYADIAEKYGAMVPFIRPPELATDTAKSADVVLHAMAHAKESGKEFDCVCLLEPTSPFITPQQLVDAVDRLFSDPEAKAVVAVREVSPSSFYIQENTRYLDKISKNLMVQGVLRRQDTPPNITPSGGFYIAKWQNFLENPSFYTDRTMGFLVPDLNGLEIDEPLDWLWAEFLIEKGLISVDEFLSPRPLD